MWGCHLHCGTISSIPGLHGPDTISILCPGYDNQKCLWILPNIPWGQCHLGENHCCKGALTAGCLYILLLRAPPQTPEPSVKGPHPNSVRAHPRCTLSPPSSCVVSLALPSNQLLSLFCSAITASCSIGLFTASSGFLTHLQSLCTRHIPALPLRKSLRAYRRG